MIKLPRLKKKTAAKKAVKKKSIDERRSFRWSSKAERPTVPRVITAWQLTKDTWKFLKENWRILSVLGLIYAIAYRVLVEGLMRFNVEAIQQNAADSDLGGVGDAAALTAGAFSATGGNVDAQSGTFAALLTIIFGLAIVWVVRRRTAGQQISARDALYGSAAPFIPVLVVLFVMFLQLLPAAVGLFLFVSATAAGVLVGGVENMALFLVAFLTFMLSAYWVVGTIIGLVAVTVPGMYPLAALRGAKELVAYRRGAIFARFMVFIILVTIIWLVVIIIMVSNGITLFLATEILDIMRGFTLVISVIYVYKLYRSLVDETAD